jgi:hypothetical protein
MLLLSQEQVLLHHEVGLRRASETRQIRVVFISLNKHCFQPEEYKFCSEEQSMSFLLGFEHI